MNPRRSPYRPLTGALFALCGLTGPVTAAEAAEAASYASQIEDWHRGRLEQLTSETGWVTLIGLFWLEEGPNTLGSAAGSTVLLPTAKAPASVGTLELRSGRLHLRVTPGVELTHGGQPVTEMDLGVDTSGAPTVLDLGDLQFHVIERAGRFGVRARDRQHPARFEFPGIEIFPIDPDWRITGRLETHDPPRTIPIPNVLGQVNDLESPGTAVFEIEDRSYALEALQGSGERLYLIFADQTSGPETYGGGRFLYSEPVATDGSVVLDFNKAHNPPCAFTDFATCPLPPRQNKLEVRIEAGEKKYGHH